MVVYAADPNARQLFHTRPNIAGLGGLANKPISTTIPTNATFQATSDKTVNLFYPKQCIEAIGSPRRLPHNMGKCMIVGEMGLCLTSFFSPGAWQESSERLKESALNEYMKYTVEQHISEMSSV